MQLQPFRRHAENRVLGGVAGGVARSIGVRPIIVRIAIVVFTNISVPLYLLAWALTPDDNNNPGFLGQKLQPNDSRLKRVGGLAVIVLGVVALLDGIGLWFPGGFAWPVILVAIGLGIVWRKTPEPSPAAVPPIPIREGLRSAHSLTDIVRLITTNWDANRRAQRFRFLVGGVLVLSGLSAMFASGRGLDSVKDSITGTLYLSGGVALIFGPTLLRMLDDLNAERRARARADAQAEIATHLHDSVLQTLAIIQRRADNPREVVTLARRQERELRAWLYGMTDVRSTDDAATVAEAFDAIAYEVESLFEIRVDFVKVGDAPLNDSLRAFVLAGREATVNAAKHSGVDEVSLYLECDPREVELFVRDRGKGFDVAAVDPDRRGLRDSIEARLEKVGGTATIRSVVGEGTEVHLRMPRNAPPGSAHATSTSADSAANTSKRIER